MRPTSYITGDGSAIPAPRKLSLLLDSLTVGVYSLMRGFDAARDASSVAYAMLLSHRDYTVQASEFLRDGQFEIDMLLLGEYDEEDQ